MRQTQIVRRALQKYAKTSHLSHVPTPKDPGSAYSRRKLQKIVHDTISTSLGRSEFSILSILFVKNHSDVIAIAINGKSRKKFGINGSTCRAKQCWRDFADV
jgi:hypothetical protein